MSYEIIRSNDQTDMPETCSALSRMCASEDTWSAKVRTASSIGSIGQKETLLVTVRAFAAPERRKAQSACFGGGIMLL
jgi:hypothetical protein